MLPVPSCFNPKPVPVITATPLSLSKAIWLPSGEYDPRRERQLLGCDHIEASGACSGVSGRRQTFPVGQALQLDVDHFAFFFRAGFRPFFAGGPLAARSSIRRIASSSVTAFGSAPLGSVAWVVPSLA